jgi:hypothetical protein
VKAGVIRTPRIPADIRLVELASVGLEGFFALHATESLTCLCTKAGPEVTCDLGWALHRLSRAALLGTLDNHVAES